MRREGGSDSLGFVVDSRHHRLRIDRFLRDAHPALGRNQLERLLTLGAVTVDGKPRDHRYFVKEGERVEIRFPASERDGGSAVRGEEAPGRKGQGLEAPGTRDASGETDHPSSEPLEIFSGAALLAVGKPPGLAVNPVAGRVSLLDWARSRPATGAGRPPGPSPVPGDAGARPGVLHRLDVETSGVVLFSRSAEAHRRAVGAFRERRLKKTYLALVRGMVEPQAGKVERPLSRSASGRVRPDAQGLEAATEFRVLDRRNGASLLEVRPLTGRMHQIRVHLAAMGHPILGDGLYGRSGPRTDRRLPSKTAGEHPPAAPRLWLHAFSIELPPRLADFLEAPRTIVCPLWEDLWLHGRKLGLRGLAAWRRSD